MISRLQHSVQCRSPGGKNDKETNADHDHVRFTGRVRACFIYARDLRHNRFALIIDSLDGHADLQSVSSVNFLVSDSARVFPYSLAVTDKLKTDVVLMIMHDYRSGYFSLLLALRSIHPHSRKKLKLNVFQP